MADEIKSSYELVDFEENSEKEVKEKEVEFELFFEFSDSFQLLTNQNHKFDNYNLFKKRQLYSKIVSPPPELS
ncbi:hypothetical protein [Aureivirga marina]|uniref:hypothetical protein n=1 Tax=Aureivirga marina TaxID=1182451 RepID=UPI0018CA998C|nr:hypothetical protein [Aureivirga marina]